MHVPREDEIERARRQEVEHIREVAEQDAQIGRLVDELPRPRRPLPVSARIDPDDLHPLFANLDRLGLVDEQVPRGKVVKACSTREWIAAVFHVVVAEDDERPAEAPDQVAQAPLPAWPRDEVPGNDDNVGVARRDPLDGALNRARPARR